METVVPLIFVEGFPASLNALNEKQLQRFLNYLWDFTRIPECTRIFPQERVDPKERIRLLRKAITNIYDRLGCSYLIGLSEGLSKSNHSTLMFDVDHQQECVYIWNKRQRNIIAKIPQSNLTYDVNIECLVSYVEANSKAEAERKRKEQRLQEKLLNLADQIAESSSGRKQAEDVIIIDEDVLEISDDDEPMIPGVSQSVTLISDDDETRLPDVSVNVTQISDDDETRLPDVSLNITQISDDDEPKIPEVPQNVTKVSNVGEPKHTVVTHNIAQEDINVIEIEDESQDSEPIIIETVQENLGDPCEETSHIVCTQVWSVTTPIELSDSDEESNITSNQSKKVFGDTVKCVPEGTRKYHHRPVKRHRKDRIPEKICEALKPEVAVLPQQDAFMLSLGLYGVNNLPEEQTSWPELNKCDFAKYHRLPLYMLPSLATRGLIDTTVLEPGPPGQNSPYVSHFGTMVSNEGNRRKYLSRRSKISNTRFKSVDVKNARYYNFPSKTFKKSLPAPIWRNKDRIQKSSSDVYVPKLPGHPPRPVSFLPTQAVRPTCSWETQPLQPTSFKLPENISLKKCSVRIRRLNPIVFKHFSKNLPIKRSPSLGK